MCDCWFLSSYIGAFMRYAASMHDLELKEEEGGIEIRFFSYDDVPQGDFEYMPDEPKKVYRFGGV